MYLLDCNDDVVVQKSSAPRSIDKRVLASLEWICCMRSRWTSR
jgi:hypothetical protein